MTSPELQGMNDVTLDGLVKHAVCQSPDLLAVLYDDGEVQTTLTYTQLWCCTQMVKDSLRGGVQEGHIVGLCLKTSQLVPSIILGVLQLGGAFYNFSADSFLFARSVLVELGVKVLVVHNNHLQKVTQHLQDCEYDTSPMLCSDLRDYSMVTFRQIGARTHTARLAYCITTSGTTGRPKIVRVPHACIVPNILQLREVFGLCPGDQMLCATALTFDPCMVEMFTTLTSGACLVMVPDSVKMAPDVLIQVVCHRNHVTVMQITPSLLYSLGRDNVRKLLGDNSSLRVLALGGERFPACDWLMTHRSTNNKTCFINLYGTTEVSCWATSYQLTEGDLRSGQEVCLGQCLLGTAVQVVDTDGTTVTDGSGRLLIGGTVRQCILSDVESESYSTSRKILRDSGDIVRLDAHGQMFYVGRLDRQVKRHGKRLNLDQIKVVTDSCPVVKWCEALMISSKLLLAVLPQGNVQTLNALPSNPGNQLTEHVTVESQISSPSNPGNQLTECDAVESQISPPSNPGNQLTEHDTVKSQISPPSNPGNQLSSQDSEPTESGKETGIKDKLMNTGSHGNFEPWIESEGLTDVKDEVMGSRDRLIDQGNNGDFTAVIKNKVLGYLQSQLPSYWMPDEVFMVDRIPLTKHGKVDMDCLTSQYLQLTTFTASDVIDLLQLKWKEHTGCSEDTIQDTSNFILAGGSSLNAVHLASDIEQSLQTDLPLLLDTILNKTFKHVEMYITSKITERGTKLVNIKESKSESAFLPENKVNMLDNTISKMNTEVCDSVKVPTGGKSINSNKEVQNDCSDVDAWTDSVNGSSSVKRSRLMNTFTFTLKRCSQRFDVQSWRGTKHSENWRNNAGNSDKGDSDNSDSDKGSSGNGSSDTGSSDKGSSDRRLAKTMSSQNEDFHQDKTEPSECECGSFIIKQPTRVKTCSPTHLKYAPDERKHCSCVEKQKRSKLAEDDRVYAINLEDKDCRWPLALRTKEVWRYNTGKCVDASPLVAVCMQERCRDVVYIGSHSHTFSAVYLSSGETIWETTLPDRVESSACMSKCGELVVVGCYDGHVYSLCSTTGHIDWSFNTGGEVKCSPTVDTNTGLVYVGSHSHNMYCLDIKNRRMVWERPLQAGSIFSSPVLCDRSQCVYVATLGGRLFSLNTMTGDILWQYILGKPVFSSLCLTAYGLCCGCTDNTLYHLDSHGQLLWKYQTDGPIFSSPCCARQLSVARDMRRVNHGTCDAVSNIKTHNVSAPPADIGDSNRISLKTSNRDIIVVGSHDCCLHCVDMETGVLLWKLNTKALIYSSPFVSTLRINLCECDRKTCKLLTMHTTSKNFKSETNKQEKVCNGSNPFETKSQSPEFHVSKIKTKEMSNIPISSKSDNSVASIKSCVSACSWHERWSCDDVYKMDVVLCATTTGTLLVLDATSGEVLCEHQLPGEIFSSPVMVDSKIVVGCRDDYLYCLDVEIKS